MRINIKITPNAKKSEILSKERDLFGGEYLRVKIAAPPIEGKANRELVNILSEHFKVSKSKISIISGQKSRNKIVEINK